MKLDENQEFEVDALGYSFRMTPRGETESQVVRLRGEYDMELFLHYLKENPLN